MERRMLEERIDDIVKQAVGMYAEDGYDDCFYPDVQKFTQAILTAVAESLPAPSSIEITTDRAEGFQVGYNTYRNQVLAQLGKEE